MKKLYVFVTLSMFFNCIHAQYLKYGFSTSQEVYTMLTGAIPVSTSISAADFLGHNKTSVPIPIGFTFNFDGVNYNEVVASSNGFLSFNILATSTPINSLSGTLSTRRPLLAPLWDDLNGATATSAARYITTGSPGARVFTMEWLNWQWSTTNSGPAISFQVKLYEGSNQISFLYRQEPAAVVNGSASIGIGTVGTGPGNFLSLKSSGTLPAASLSIETTTISTKPATGQVYTFVPLTACSGSPVGGTTINNNPVTCVGLPVVLDVTGGSTAADLSFQWQSSSNGQNWTDLPATGMPFYTITSVSAQQYYRRKTTCSGEHVFSTPVLVTPAGAPVNDNYCSPLPLNVNAAPHCGSTNCATAVNDPVFSRSTPNNTVWYTFTPSSTGPATIVMSRPAEVDSGFLDGWLGIFSLSGSCTAPMFTEVPSSLSFNLTATREVILTTPNLTAAVTYYLMIDGSAGAYGNYCIQVVPNPVVPFCTSNLAPLNGSTVDASFTSISWNPAANATAYDVMVSEDTGRTYMHKATLQGNSGTVTTLSDLRPGAVYYWYVVPRSGGGPATGCQSSASMFRTAEPPPCVDTYISPVSNATGVPVNTPVVFEWTAVHGATSYDHYVGTSYPPTTLYKNTPNTTDTVSLLLYNTKYYWTVRPRNNFIATACRIDSFTTAAPVVTCTPLHGRGVAVGDSLAVFRLKGEGASQLENSPAPPNSSYNDYYNLSNVTLGAGNAYVGFARTGASSNRITIWIDYNNNGFFEKSERLLNNQDVTSSTSGTYFSIYVPPTADPGEHRMRVRNIYNEVQPVDPCNSYAYGEAEDYKVTIVTGFVPRGISPGAVNNCLVLASTIIDTASNNTGYFVPILDTTGNLVMSINAGGNSLGKITAPALFVNRGNVRTSAGGIKYLDRNFVVNASTAVVPTPVTLRFYYTSDDLAALQLADPSVSGSPAINMSRSAANCSTGGAAPVFDSLYLQSGSGRLGNDYYADFPVQSFSAFYLHGSATALPVRMTPLSGERVGSTVLLQWSTFSEANSSGFEVERSIDGVNFAIIGFVASKAAGGRSVSTIMYELTDLSPGRGAAYYRLRQIDRDGGSLFSNVIKIALNQSWQPFITSMYPNPASATLNVVINAATHDIMKIIVTDATGKTLLKKSQQVNKGDNVIQLDLRSLSRGSYLLSISCPANCAGISRGFVRQ